MVQKFILYIGDTINLGARLIKRSPTRKNSYGKSFCSDMSSLSEAKEELYESLKGLWEQIKDGLISLDEAGYRALMVASYFHDDGKKIAEKFTQ